MADVKKIATRDSYGNALSEIAAEHDDLIVFDADLAGATKTGIFKKAFPDRHFNCGIAEGNMIAVAAGASTAGLVPFASSFAMFAAGRAFEQIRNSIGYPHLNVKIGATHGGISVGEDGASHQCCEDFALMRSIPGMVVMSPADDVEARAMVKAAYEYVGPVYIRFGRAAVPVFHDESYKFEMGKGEVIQDGTDVAIIANGLMVAEAIEAGRLWPRPASPPASSTCTPSSPSMKIWCSRPPRSAARSSPARSTTSSAVWARLCAAAWPRSAPLPCAASVSTTSSVTPVPLPPCSSSSVCAPTTLWRSPRTSAASNLYSKTAATGEPVAAVFL